MAAGHWSLSEMYRFQSVPFVEMLARLLYILLVISLFHIRVDSNDHKRKYQLSNYSSHYCIGGHQYKRGAAERKCIFHNVCHMKGEGDILHYYVDPTLPSEIFLADDNRYYYDFIDSKFLHLGVYERFSDSWAPTVEFGSKPQFEYDEASTNVFIQTFAEYNPGHFMDFLHSIYASQLIHGLNPTPHIRVLDHFKNKPCFKHRQGLLKGLSQYDPMKLGILHHFKITTSIFLV